MAVYLPVPPVPEGLLQHCSVHWCQRAVDLRYVPPASTAACSPRQTVRFPRCRSGQPHAEQCWNSVCLSRGLDHPAVGKTDELASARVKVKQNSMHCSRANTKGRRDETAKIHTDDEVYTSRHDCPQSMASHSGTLVLVSNH